MNKGLKQKIIHLRNQKWSYKAIQEKLHCARSTIAYHCKQLPHNEDIKFQNTALIDKTILSWDNDTTRLITSLYKMYIRQTEIADVLELDVAAIRRFCRPISRRDFSTLSNYNKVKLRRKKLKLLAVIFKGQRCEKCGYDKCYEGLAFHHEDPKSKEFGIFRKSSVSWKKLKKEISKCSLLCTNCHAEVHADLNGDPLKNYIQWTQEGSNLSTFRLSGECSAT